jgi:formylglycine-generating enzyme required for sulfatase activity
MPTPDLLQQDGLTLDERFFARIAVKNGLLTETDLALATRERVASGRTLPEVLKARGLLDDVQIAKVREAQAASQVVRIDSLYADILVQRRLVPRSGIEEAFAEQRKRRYKVRLGDLLVERGLLSLEGHRAVLGSLLRKIAEEEPKQLGSTAERRGLRAEELASGSRSSAGLPVPSTPLPLPRPAAVPEAPPRPPQASIPTKTQPIVIPLDSESDVALASDTSIAGGREGAEPPPRSPERAPRIPGVARTIVIPPPGEGSASFLESNAQLIGAMDDARGPGTSAAPAATSEDEKENKLVASALALRLSSQDEDSEFREDDKKRVAEDVSRIESSSLSPALERVVKTPTSDTGERFSPEQWLARKQRRRRIAVVGTLALVFGLLAPLGGAIGVALGHRRAFDDAASIVRSTEGLTSAEQERAFARARDRLAAARGFGLSDQRFLALEARIVTGAARAAAASALERADPKEAQRVLQAALEKLAADDDDDRAVLNTLLIQADKDALTAAGKAAEDRREWRSAVELYRNANADAQQQRVHKKMSDELHDLSDAALRTRQRADRDALAAAIKLYLEIWNDRMYLGLLDDVDFHLALWGAQDALGQGDAARCVELLKKALKLKDGDAEATVLLDRAQRRIQLDQLLDRARAEARDSRLDDAARDYQEALPKTAGDEHRQVEAELATVLARRGDLEKWKVLERKRTEVVDLARASDWDGVLAKVEGLEAAGEKDGARLRTFATRARGMVLIPAGPFVYGSDDASHDPKKLILPRKTLDLGAYLIDVCEVANKDYADFIKTSGHAPPGGWKDNLVLPNGQPARRGDEVIKTFPAGEERLPVSTVTWQDAQDYAKAAGKRLPSDAEWEKAARGVRGQKYPWGEKDEPPGDVRIQCETFVRAAACGDSRADVSPEKVHDMAGNVAEWCSDVHPTQDGKKHRVIRGGSFRKTVAEARGYYREEAEETRSWDDVGFRCALDLADAPSWLRDALKQAP